ncbi:hypothetical protein LguiB_024152 [Lonicera macranthoides]
MPKMASPLPPKSSSYSSTTPNQTRSNRSPSSPPNKSSSTLNKTPPSSSASAFAIFSSFVKNVCLSKWWLIKIHTADPNIKSFGVQVTIELLLTSPCEARRISFKSSSFPNGLFRAMMDEFFERVNAPKLRRQGRRDFRSEAISKRIDTSTIETVNGITINLIGFIDAPRTRKNGFPSEVCHLFHFGFPYHWEEYAARFCGEESNKDDIPSGVSTLDGANNSHSNLNNPLPTSFDDIPVSQVRDLLRCPTEDSEYDAILRIISNDILRKCGDNSSKHNGLSIPSNDKRKDDETPRDHSSKHSGPTIHSNERSKYETPKGHRESIQVDDCISNTKLMKKRKSEKLDAQSKTGLRLGVATRSMRKRESDKNLSSASFCEPEASTLAKRRAANSSDLGAVDLFGEMGFRGTPNKSGLNSYSGEDLVKLSGQQVVLGKRKNGEKMDSSEYHTKVLLSGVDIKVREKLVESAVRRSKRLNNLSKC